MDDWHLVVRAELVRTLEQARKTRQHGIFLVALIPAALGVSAMTMFLSPVVGVILFLLAGIYALVGGLAGAGMFLIGTVERRHGQRDLRALDARRMLPPARVVKR